MKTLLYTQRVEIVKEYRERRDCADQRIAKFIWSCGFVPVPVNNDPENAESFVRAIHPVGIILTGGNDLLRYGGNAPERDATEKILIDVAVRDHLPLFGFCRGMQMIADYFGADLCRVSGHVACRHPLLGDWGGRTVNSYHRCGLREPPKSFTATAWTEDGLLEAMRHREKRIWSVMWHPERENPFGERDGNLIKEWLGV